MNYVSSNLRFLRKSKGWSQEEFAKQFQMNRSNIASYENGNAQPNIDTIIEIVKYFNIDVVSFVKINLRESTQGAKIGRKAAMLDGFSLNSHMSKFGNGIVKLPVPVQNQLKDMLEGLSKDFTSLTETILQQQNLIHKLEKIVETQEKLMESMKA